MQYHGPDAADLANVFVLNDAFIAWQRTRPLEESRERGLAPEVRAKLGELNGEQRERLARTPFLLMSLAEDDEARWQSLFAAHGTRELLQCLQVRDEAASGLVAAGLGFLWQLAQRVPYATRLVRAARRMHAHGSVLESPGRPDVARAEDGGQHRSVAEAADGRRQ